MAKFEYLLEWNPRKADIKADFWRVSNVTYRICQEFHDVDEAFDHIAEHNSLWPDERIWAYRFGEEVVLLHMENESEEKNNILEMKGWC